MMRTAAQWALIVFAAYFLLHSPGAAAGLVRHLGDGLSHAASSLSAFVSHL